MPSSGNHPAPHDECVALIQQHLRSEAAGLLTQAERNVRSGLRRNAEWCWRAAFGHARSIGSITRWQAGR